MSTQIKGRKSLEIPEGTSVLLCDHPEGYKIQDKYKSEEFVSLQALWTQCLLH